MARMSIEKKTAAETKLEYFDGQKRTVHVAGILVAETIAVNIMDMSGAALPLYDSDGNAVTITATSPPLKIDTPITLQFVKPITANVVGVQVVG